MTRLKWISFDIEKGRFRPKIFGSHFLINLVDLNFEHNRAVFSLARKTKTNNTINCSE